MKNAISITDFRFEFAGYGHYKVQYTSPITGKSWTCKTANMPLIDETKNADEPTKRALNDLKSYCKRG
jgi:hypothetical protein